MRKTSMYVVFMHDPQSKNYKTGSAMYKGIYECFGPQTLFYKDACFNSINEAKRYISKLLRKRQMIGGRLRRDIKRKNFLIHQVRKHNLHADSYVLDRKGTT